MFEPTSVAVLRFVGVLAALLAAFGSGFGAGRGSAPARVEVHEVERWREREALHTEEKVQAQTESETHRQTVTYRETARAKDGSSTTKELQVSSAGTVKREDLAAAVATTATREASGDREHSEVRIRDPPAWRVSALAGLDARVALQLRIAPVYGALVEHRLLGPLYVGAWGLSSGAVGVVVSIEF